MTRTSVKSRDRHNRAQMLLKQSSGGGPRDTAGVRTDEAWRAEVESCVVESGDEEELDLDKLRQEVRKEAKPLSKGAKLVEEIIKQWEASKDDKTFAMRTRFFPSGVKIPGVKWT